MMTKKVDALASAAAELRAAAEPERARRDAKRAERAAEQERVRVEWEARRERFLEIARPASDWYANWIERGRLALLLAARPDERPRSLALSDLWMRKGKLVWEHEHKRPITDYAWPVFRISLGERIDIHVSGPHTRVGTPNGSVARLRRLVDLGDVATRKRAFGWPGLDCQILDAGTRLAELFQNDVLEPLLASRARGEAVNLRRRAVLDEAVRAFERGDPGARERLVERLIEDGRLSGKGRGGRGWRAKEDSAVQDAVYCLLELERREDDLERDGEDAPRATWWRS